MTDPHASALNAAPSHVSRYSGRPVATRADGLPVWFNRASLSPDSRVNANRTEAASGEGETR